MKEYILGFGEKFIPGTGWLMYQMREPYENWVGPGIKSDSFGWRRLSVGIYFRVWRFLSPLHTFGVLPLGKLRCCCRIFEVAWSTSCINYSISSLSVSNFSVALVARPGFNFPFQFSRVLVLYGVRSFDCRVIRIRLWIWRVPGNWTLENFSRSWKTNLAPTDSKRGSIRSFSELQGFSFGSL